MSPGPAFPAVVFVRSSTSQASDTRTQTPSTSPSSIPSSRPGSPLLRLNVNTATAVVATTDKASPRPTAAATATATVTRSTSTSTTTTRARPARVTAATLPTSSNPPPLDRYIGTGNLLANYCATAEYTLIDGGATLYYAPFVGCINNRPDCCPTGYAGARTAGPLTTQRTTIAFPQAQNPEDATMAHCADDYYSISGSCCPSGFAPWTTVLGDQTPCYRTLDRTTMTTPPLTSTRNPSRTSKPTVVYSNVVYAMQYAVQESEGGGGLSAGAIAGITIGTLLGVLGIGGLVYFLYRRHRSAQRIPDFKSEIRSGYYGPDPSEAPTSERGAQRSEVSSSSLARDVGLQHDGTRSPHQNQPSERRVQKKPSNAGSNRVLEPMPSQGQTPSDRDEQDEGYPPQSGTSSPLETQGILEVSLARPQRLSRGYARIVYTNPQGSSSSVPTKGSMDSRREGSMNIKGSMDSRRGDRVTSLNLAPRPCRGED